MGRYKSGKRVNRLRAARARTDGVDRSMQALRKNVKRREARLNKKTSNRSRVAHRGTRGEVFTDLNEQTVLYITSSCTELADVNEDVTLECDSGTDRCLDTTLTATYGPSPSPPPSPFETSSQFSTFDVLPCDHSAHIEEAKLVQDHCYFDPNAPLLPNDKMLPTEVRFQSEVLAWLLAVKLSSNASDEMMQNILKRENHNISKQFAQFSATWRTVKANFE